MLEATDRIGPTAPTKTVPNVTAGLNKPPLIRKNTQALTTREKPKASEMKRSLWRSGPEELPVPEEFATWVPKKAKKRKRKVPTNSPLTATNSRFTVSRTPEEVMAFERRCVDGNSTN